MNIFIVDVVGIEYLNILEGGVTRFENIKGHICRYKYMNIGVYGIWTYEIRYFPNMSS